MATYSGDANYLPATSGCNDANETTKVVFAGPHMSIVKTADPTHGPAPLAVTYTYVVTNDGTDSLYHTTVTDDSCGPIRLVSGDVNANQLLDSGEVWTYRCSQTLPSSNTNTAVVEAKNTQSGLPVRAVSDNVTVTVGDGPPPPPPTGAHMTLSAVASPSSGPAPLEVTYTYSLKNDGTEALFDVVVADSSCSPVVVQSGDNDGDAVLDPGEVWTLRCTATRTVTHTSDATASATSVATGLRLSTEYRLTVYVTGATSGPVAGPHVSLTKVANPTSGPAPLSVTYTYRLLNDGTDTLFHAGVSDNTCAPATYSGGDTNHDQLLDPAETWTFTCTQTLPEGTHTNTATGGGTNTQTGLGVVSAPASATVTVGSGGGGGTPPPDSSSSAPTNLTVTGRTASTVGLSWNPVAGASEYRAYVSQSSGGGYVLWASGFTGSSATLYSLSGNYYVVVRAVVNGVESPNSNEVLAAAPSST